MFENQNKTNYHKIYVNTKFRNNGFSFIRTRCII